MCVCVCVCVCACVRVCVRVRVRVRVCVRVRVRVRVHVRVCVCVRESIFTSSNTPHPVQILLPRWRILQVPARDSTTGDDAKPLLQPPAGGLHLPPFRAVCHIHSEGSV